MSHSNRLIILSTSESPAWQLELLPGQIYAGCDQRESGCFALIITLGETEHLTHAQDVFLSAHPDVLRYELFPAGCSTILPDCPHAPASPADGTRTLPSVGKCALSATEAQ